MSVPKGFQFESIPVAASINDHPPPPPITQVDESTGERNYANILFVNLDTLGLRCSPRIGSLVTAKYKQSCDLMVLAMPSFVSVTPFVTAYSANCFQNRVIGYNDFLERNFDRTANQTSPLVQIYLSSQSNNKT